MRIYVDDPGDWEFVDDFFWSDGKENVEKIYNAGKLDEFRQWVEDNFPEGIERTKLNDIMSFEPEPVFEALGIED